MRRTRRYTGVVVGWRQADVARGLGRRGDNTVLVTAVLGAAGTDLETTVNRDVSCFWCMHADAVARLPAHLRTAPRAALPGDVDRIVRAGSTHQALEVVASCLDKAKQEVERAVPHQLTAPGKVRACNHHRRRRAAAWSLTANQPLARTGAACSTRACMQPRRALRAASASPCAACRPPHAHGVCVDAPVPP